MTAEKQSILVIMTGGTIDAEPYEATPDRVTPKDKSQIPALVDQLGLAESCDFFQWKMKDSQDFSEDEIQQLADIIRADERRYFIITHGTDAMVKNAQLLNEALKGSGKTALFVGAMQPLAHGAASDGPENMKLALEVLMTDTPSAEGGAFIVGRGDLGQGRLGPRIFRPDETKKDRVRKIFVETEPHKGMAL